MKKERIIGYFVNFTKNSWFYVENTYINFFKFFIYPLYKRNVIHIDLYLPELAKLINIKSPRSTLT